VATPGETDFYSIDFARDIPTGDVITSVSTALTVHYGTDAAPSSSIIGPPTYAGSVVTQIIGGAYPAGLQPARTYNLILTATTANGYVVVKFGRVNCEFVPTPTTHVVTVPRLYFRTAGDSQYLAVLGSIAAPPSVAGSAQLDFRTAGKSQYLSILI
jgi:hypothetical protein